MSIPPDAYVGHLSPGRVRIKIPSRKKQEPYFSSLQEEFAKAPGITAVEANPVTGSLLIRHKLDDAALCALLHVYNVKLPSEDMGASSGVHKEVATIVGGMNRRVKSFSRGALNLEAVAAIALIGSTVYQISRGRVTAIPWYNGIWYAYALLKG